jgi:hypothetical protein
MYEGPLGPQPDSRFLRADEFDGDEDDWYIELRALEVGADRYEAVREVRAALNRRERFRAPPVEQHEEAAQPRADDHTGAVPWPPGRAGAIARFLYQTSYCPIQEVAITATLGLLAGVCGRGYRTHTGKDLALYMILVAKSGVGKDALHEGIPMMLKRASSPFAPRFCRAQDFASGEALHKELLRDPGFLYLQGEFGKKLKRMANPTDAPMQSFRTIMTNAFGKKFLEGKSYSRAEDSILGVDWPALSFVGETTQDTFHECLTPDMMSDGFLSRFLVVSYGGDRPFPNHNRNGLLESADAEAWGSLVEHAVQYQWAIGAPAAMDVLPDPDARAMLDGFEVDCIKKLRGTEKEVERQVWTRAHIKVMKAAALLAVVDHYLRPIVTVQHVEWAVGLIERDIETFLSRQSNGDIGVDDDARERKLLSFLKEYIVKPVPASYNVKPQMAENGIVPRKYLQVRSASLPAFTNHKLGTSKALDDTIRSLIANGTLMEVKLEKLVEAYSFHGKAYRILEL